MTTAPIAVITPTLPAAQQLLVLLKSSGFVEQRAQGQRLFKCFHGEHTGKTFVMRRPDRDAFQNLERILANTAAAPEIVAEPAQIPPPPAETAPKSIATSNGSYDPKTYETEIKKALARSSTRYLDPESKKDLRQIIHIEIWQATNRYGDKMNPALAYQIARIHIAKFIDKLAKEPTSLSIDDKPENKEGDEVEMSEAEMILYGKTGPEGSKAGLKTEGVRTWEFGDNLLSMGNPGSWTQALEERGGMALLRKLASTWHGTKRQVAEAMLHDPDMTVRDIPGISKTTVHRVRQVVWNEFQNLIRTPLPSTNRVLAQAFLKFIGDRGLTMEMLLALPVEQQQNIRSSFLTESNQVTG
jgi:hypothetical protein